MNHFFPKHHLRRLLVVGIALGLLAGPSVTALAQTPAPPLKGSGVISGTVTNGTTSQLIPGIEVQLGIFDSSALLETRTVTTDAAGLFRFSELPVDSSLVYAAQVEYPAGIPYGSPATSFTAGTSSIDLPLSIYEPTSDPSGVKVDRVHFIVEFDPAAGQVFVTELAVYSLSGNLAFVGSGMGTLRFTVPDNATDLQISDGELGGRYVAFAGGFADTMPMPPGQGSRQMLYSYAVPYFGDALEITRAIPYPAAAVNALIADAGEQVTSAQLASQGVRQTQNGAFINLLGQNIAANEPIILRFTGLSSLAAAAGAGNTMGTTTQPATAAAGADRSVLFILLGAAGVAAVALAASPFLRRRAAGVRTAGVRAADGTPMDRDEILDALARLDLNHEAGQVSDSAFRDERMRLKAQLLDLARQPGDSPGGTA